MNTLAQYQNLTTNKLLKGVIETIIKESPILKRLPFREFSGNSWMFNIEDTMATVNYYAVNDVWTENAATWAQGSVGLAIMGGDADTDIFAAKTKGDINDLRAVVIEGKAKAMAHQFEKDFIHGGTTVQVNAKGMKGILLWIANYETTALTTTDLDAVNNSQVIANSAASGTLTVAKLDELIDAVRPKAECLITNRRIRRYMSNALAYAGSSSSPVTVEKDQWGEFISVYNGTPVLVNDFMNDNIQDGASSVLDIVNYNQTTARAAGYDNSMVLAMRFSETNGITGVNNGGIDHEDLGQLETKHAYRDRFAWYCNTAMLGTRSAAVLINVVADAL